MLVPAIAESPCPGCRQVTSGKRCGRCGVALNPGGYFVQRVLTQKAHSRTYLATDLAGRDLVVEELIFSEHPTVRDIETFAGISAALNQLVDAQLPGFLTSFSEGDGADTRLYLVHKYIDGESLETQLASGPLSELEVIVIAEQVLGILRYLQGATPKVTHGDVKPANLIRDGKGKLWLVDFGAWRPLRPHEADDPTGYWPSRGPYDETGDLFALGVTLVRLRTGQAPNTFVHRDQLQSSASLPPSPFRLWLARLIAPHEQRYRSADVALLALQPVKRGQNPPEDPVGSAPADRKSGALLLTGATSRLRPWLRRLAILLMLIGLGVAGRWAYYRVRLYTLTTTAGGRTTIQFDVNVPLSGSIEAYRQKQCWHLDHPAIHHVELHQPEGTLRVDLSAAFELATPKHCTEETTFMAPGADGVAHAATIGTPPNRSTKFSFAFTTDPTRTEFPLTLMRGGHEVGRALIDITDQSVHLVE